MCSPQSFHFVAATIDFQCNFFLLINSGKLVIQPQIVRPVNLLNAQLTGCDLPWWTIFVSDLRERMENAMHDAIEAAIPFLEQQISVPNDLVLDDEQRISVSYNVASISMPGGNRVLVLADTGEQMLSLFNSMLCLIFSCSAALST